MTMRAGLRSVVALLLAGGLLLLSACGGSPSASSAGHPSTTAASGGASGSAPGGSASGAPRNGRSGRGGFGGFFDLNAAAQYLGLSTDQLRQQLQQGRSLAQVAQAQGKSVQGLEQALVQAAKSRLDQAVQGGRMTAQQEQQRLQSLEQGIAGFVNRTGLPGQPQGHANQSGS